MKKKVLFSSIATIALCLCLIAGSTFALFTSQSKVDISVTAGNVKMTASIADLMLYSVEGDLDGTLVDENGNKYSYKNVTADNKFINGGTANFADSVLTMNDITPGDKVTFNITGKNDSDVAVQYRYIIECINGYKLMSGLNVIVNGETYKSLASYTSAWNTLDVGKNLEDKTPVAVTIELPVAAGNEFQNETAEIRVVVEAVQGNAVTSGDLTVECFTLASAKPESVKDALLADDYIILGDDVAVNDAAETESNAYGNTGLSINNNQVFDGAGNTLSVPAATGTWDSAISTTGGTIKNLTIDAGFRGIFINHNSTNAGKVYLENVIIDGTVYTISCDQGTGNGLEATSCTFNGWTSYAATLGEATFTNCSFGEGAGYAFCRPYAATTFINCDFESGYEIDARAAVTLIGCRLDGVLITDANVATLVTGNTANVTVR